MDSVRRQKDRSYKNVFKGSLLVGTLMEHNTHKFVDRAAAVKFAQRLLDQGHIESVVGSNTFEDSVGDFSREMYSQSFQNFFI